MIVGERERELRVKYDSLVLVQENIERIEILGVVIGESGRGLGVVDNNSPKS